MIGLDTTVLLAHEIREATGHQRVREHIARACKQGDTVFAVAPQVLQEFVHVATDPRRFTSPLSMEEALDRAANWWRAAEVRHCHPAEQAWEQSLIWMKQFGLGRKRILDTYLAATYLEAGIGRIATANANDFALFGVFQFEPWALAKD